ncbi:MAG: carbohydrate ABC transporter permease [Anaerolineae bacterium]|nr:carbohydrate ABC transporter permease [Anaerolineae bacterium]MDW8101013.1 carbohydrate ABC transporter permease [Anaerolineae bacterium]
MSNRVSTRVIPLLRFRISLSTVLLWLVLTPIGITLVVPVWYMVAKAFTPEINQLKWPIVWVPDPFTLENFKHIFADKTLPIMRWMANSFLVTGVGTALVLFLSSLSAYGFARLQFPGRDLIFFILLISMMVPGVATLIPTFLLLRDLRLLDNYLSLWLPGAASVGAIFFLRQQFFAIPRELEDAAVIDGAGRFRVFWQVCLPLVQSALIAQGILTAMAFWNDLYWPLITLSTRELLTLPVGLMVLSQGSYIQRGLAFAGGFIATVPPLLIYAIFQRQIIQGMATAGLAGR